VYERIKAYAPYENVKAQAYPAMLVMAGYNDSRVQYWEAAKWVARLRTRKTDDNLLLLKTEWAPGMAG
jgi:oligopeptidase B